MSAAELREGMTKWSVVGPRQFVDKRSRLTRDSGVVYQHVRAYRGVIVRKEDGKLRYANCLHAHNKPGAARRCAEREARKRNRLGDYWKTEE